MRKAGRHFLQIPGPSAVPDRILRSIGQQTIDHRGPSFAKVGLQSLSGIKSIFNKVENVFIFQKSGLKPPTSVGKDPTVRRRRSKPLNPSTLVGGGSVTRRQGLALGKQPWSILCHRGTAF